jgi:methyl-accepting chemotaxis protein
MSEELAATSGQVSEAMVQMTRAADSQVAALREADAHLGELRESGSTTLRAALRVTAVATSTTQMADDQREHVLAASATLLALRETVRQSAIEVREATKLADRVGSIVDRDRQLATKVGVLAVNSAIEAARAGPHGRGITQVAEELRQLGELCEQAVTDGERAVAALQAQVQATASTLDAGTNTMLGVEATADRAATALAEIARGIAEASRAAGRVVDDATTAREGVSAMLERTAAVAQAAADHAETGDSVSAAAEEQAAATEEMAAAAARLNDAARRLTALLDGFRT